MKNYYWIIIISILISPFVFGKEKQKVIITIKDFSKDKIPIAISSLKNSSKKELDPRALEIANTIYETMENDLKLTSWFNIIDKKAFLVDETKEVSTAEIDFPKWAAIDALYLIKGSFEDQDGKIKVNLYLFDVTSRKLLFAKSYEGLNETKRRIAHTFANEIVKNVTGEAGIFTTKIVAVRKKNGSKEIVYMDFDGQNIVQVTSAGNINLCPRWSKDGTKIAYISKRGLFWGVFVADLVNKKISPLTKMEGNIFSVSYSPVEDILAVSKEIDSDSEIVLMSEKGEMIKRLTNSFNVDVSPSWSQDGKRIVYTSSRTKRPQIYIMNKDGSDNRRLTMRGENDETPSWSPKGDTIAFTGLDNDREFDIFTVDVEGKNYKRLTYDSKNNEYPSWSPDGRFIAFSSNRDGKYQIWIMNKDGGNQRRLTDGNFEYFSPDWAMNTK